jgi:outer membrane biosynthesis protein TonB
MTRLARMLVPLSLSALLAGAAAVACSHRGEAPATPRPEPTSPSGMPMIGGGASTEGSGPDDAGVDGLLATPPARGSSPTQSSLMRMRGARDSASPTVLLASQPASPSVPSQPAPSQPPGSPPTGAPSPSQPGAPSPSQPAPSQPTPSKPTPSKPSPAQPSPTQPSPSQPAPSQPAPSQPSPGSGAPGPSSGPADAGVFDAGLPQLPPIVDAGIPGGDGGMQPIRRN